MKPNDPLPCGHPALMLVRSVESDYCFCELCEARKERDDALQMEAHLGARVRVLEEALRETSQAMAKLTLEGVDRGKGHWPAWDDTARAVDKARAALRAASA